MCSQWYLGVTLPGEAGLHQVSDFQQADHDVHDQNTLDLLNFLETAAKNIKKTLNQTSRSRRKISHRKYIEKQLRRYGDSLEGRNIVSVNICDQDDKESSYDIQERSLKDLFDLESISGTKSQKLNDQGSEGETIYRASMKSRNLPSSFFIEPALRPKTANNVGLPPVETSLGNGCDIFENGDETARNTSAGLRHTKFNTSLSVLSPSATSVLFSSNSYRPDSTDSLQSSVNHNELDNILIGNNGNDIWSIQTTCGYASPVENSCSNENQSCLYTDIHGAEILSPGYISDSSAEIMASSSIPSSGNIHSSSWTTYDFLDICKSDFNSNNTNVIITNDITPHISDFSTVIKTPVSSSTPGFKQINAESQTHQQQLKPQAQYFGSCHQNFVSSHQHFHHQRLLHTFTGYDSCWTQGNYHPYFTQAAQGPSFGGHLLNSDYSPYCSV